MTYENQMKVLIIYNKIWPYREKIFELLSNHFDLTVAYSDPQYLGKKYPFKTKYVGGRRIGPVFLHTKNIHQIAVNYDAVISLFDIRWLFLMLISLIPWRKYSVSYWGIGVRASYVNKFDSKNIWDSFRFFFCKHSESLILYSTYPVNKYIKAGIPPNKIFVAHNTTVVNFDDEDTNYDEKSNFLFVGTLYPQKGLDILLDAYLELIRKVKDIPTLDIVGDGPELTTIINFKKKWGLNDRIVTHGSIYDSKKLSRIYKKALACISPNQAGLSVLTSMGNGTIFVTEESAITGGEIFNIQNRINGILYKGAAKELAVEMNWLINNKNSVKEMSIAARKHYVENRTPEQMANTIIKSVEYAIKSKSYDKHLNV